MLKRLFGWMSGSNQEPENQILPADPIADDYAPKKGSFFQTQEYPVTGEDNETVIGRTWMEAGYNADKNSWVLIMNTVKEMEDVLQGGTKSVLKNAVLFESTTLSNAYAQMDSFEKSQNAQNIKPLANKNIDKLGQDYYRQFAWTEGLMMSRSGRLYPADEKLLTADNFFNEQDIKDAQTFLDRYNKIKFVPVPLSLPGTDWEKAYEADQTRIDERLNALRKRHELDNDGGYALACQIVANESPGILYAYLKSGFNPKIFEKNAKQHYGLLKAAIERSNIEPLSLLSEAGLSFYVRFDEETPVERAIREKRYSHLHIMLTRDGVKLANYADETHVSPAVQAIELRDNQAFQRLYLEGIDYSKADQDGWYLIHHAFANDFIRGIYAWIDEPLPIDFPIEGTEYTGLSIAKRDGNDSLIKFASEHGASTAVSALPEEKEIVVEEVKEAKIPEKSDNKHVAAEQEFSLELLSSGLSNNAIKSSAKDYVDAGGDLNIIDKDGNALLELCWNNHKKTKATHDRRALISFFGELGADPSASLSDGTTVLTREARSRSIDMDFIKELAPYAKDVNNTGLNGNNIMHALQLNANDQVGHSSNIKKILKLFPSLDLNHQNDDGYSNIGLAIRLNRSKTLELFVKHLLLNDGVADFTQITKAGWSYLDIAFTSAFSDEKCDDFPLWANKIDEISDALQSAVLKTVKSAVLSGDSEQTQAVYDVLNRHRPDGKTLARVMSDEKVSEKLINDLVICGMQRPPATGGTSPQPN